MLVQNRVDAHCGMRVIEAAAVSHLVDMDMYIYTVQESGFVVV